jgi:SpoVK/Ycf46/Vps4 family AAA+-type ATPase
LDGLEANEGVCTILTTNFPQFLPKALLDRPGRFHDICNFSLPDEEVRTKMIKHFISDISDKTLLTMVKQTNGFSGAYIKEMVDFAKMIQKDESCDIDNALMISLEKLYKQRSLIQQIETYRNRNDEVSI